MAPFDSDKLTHLMDAAHMDLLLASTRHNVRYCTGGYVYHFHDRGQRMGSSQYLAFVGIPRGHVDDAFYIGASGEKMGLDVLPLWIGRRTSMLAMRRRPPMPPQRWRNRSARRTVRLASRCHFYRRPRLRPCKRSYRARPLWTRPTCCTNCARSKRTLKSTLMRDVSDRVATAIQVGFHAGHHGVSTRELAAAIEKEMGTHGVTFLWALTNAGPGYLRAPSETRWERGRLLHLDCGGEEQDYLADICRMGALGEPSALGQELTDACLAVQDAVRRQLKAGMTYGEVNAATQDALRRNSHASIGRIVAHGIGMVSHEQPMINRADQADRTLQSGHILSLETEFLHPEVGHVKIEDTIAIRPHGAEGLGDIGRALQVIR